MFKLDQTCSNLFILFKLVWTWCKFIKLVQTESNFFKLDQIWSNWIKLDQIGINRIKLDQIGLNLIKLDQIGSNLIKLLKLGGGGLSPTPTLSFAFTSLIIEKLGLSLFFIHFHYSTMWHVFIHIFWATKFWKNSPSCFDKKLGDFIKNFWPITVINMIYIPKY